jgi:hypothetical protein
MSNREALERLPLRIDDDVVSALPTLFGSIPGLKTFKLFTIRHLAPLRQRLLANPELASLAEPVPRPLGGRSPVRWTSVLEPAAISRLSSGAVNALLQGACLHASSQGALKSEDISVRTVSPDDLRRRIEALPSDAMLAMSSGVVGQANRTMHLPMLDLALPFSRDNTRVVAELAAFFGMPSAIFSSGNSYHYYGLHLQTAAQYFHDFLPRALLLAPLVDARWVAHQLQDMLATLRISPHLTGGQTPRLVATTGSL